MPGQTEFVQPIALLRAGTHEDAVAAVAHASVTAYANTIEDAAWTPWVKRRFAKTVRRARATPFAQVEHLAAAKSVVGEAQALAFLPTTYDAMDPLLSRMQVAGTELPRRGWAPAAKPHASRPLVAINEGIEMSTGKAAAQAAHGLFAWFLTLTPDGQSAWTAARSPFEVTGLPTSAFEDAAAQTRLVISDAGFTEIPSGSRTIAVLTH
jgi:peptidyl-tRNA hydrolase